MVSGIIKVFIANNIVSVEKSCRIKIGFAKTLLILSLLLQGVNAHAVSMSRPVGNESRIRVVNYVPNSVISFTGHYNYHSIIEFSMDEKIETITMGDSTAWQLNPVENRIFLKPVGLNATTNMTVITNRRTYFFEMHADHATSISDANLAFITKFMYPSDQLGVPNAVGHNNSSGTDISKPGQYNFKYKISGKSRFIEPILVFDDGRFTYFKFKDVNADIPSIFMVDDNQNEALINYRVSDGYVVVERVTSKFTLRFGKDVICIFNEKMEIPVKLPKMSEITQTQNGAVVVAQPGVKIIQPKG
jgi:type IV secretion system protein VirB9